MPRFIWRAVSAIIFVVCFVLLAKVAQYAAVAQFGKGIGFETASLIGLLPVIALAFMVDRRLRRKSLN